MYQPDQDIEPTALRQGDIVGNVHLLGAINLNAIQYSSSYNEPDKKTACSLPTEPKFGDAMVLSHSCEIAIENNVKITSIILSPVRDASTATRPEKLDELIDSNIIDENTPRSYLKYFYLEPNPQLVYPGGAIVDFSKCFSVRKQSFDLLLDNKKIQLREDAVEAMSIKLALYFHRTLNAA